jgi:hypothetical protein
MASLNWGGLFSHQICNRLGISYQQFLIQYIGMITPVFFGEYHVSFDQCFNMMTYRRLCKLSNIFYIRALHAAHALSNFYQDLEPRNIPQRLRDLL